jgi:hypothetical protein
MSVSRLAARNGGSQATSQPAKAARADDVSWTDSLRRLSNEPEREPDA